ncbi:MAG: GtrA family protein [Clostridia bacterium]|nr:GtrA family protein [Clostridia bacterium]
MRFIFVLISVLTKSVKKVSKGVFSLITSIIDYVIYIIFIEWFGLNSIISNIISWIVTEFIYFIYNKILTYKGRGRWQFYREFVVFLIAQIFILIFETVILEIGIKVFKFNDIVVKSFVSGLSFVITILVYRHIVFRKSKYISKIKLLRDARNKILKRFKQGG